MVTLKDGSEVEDARLDRIPQFDERSRNFAVSAKVAEPRLRSTTWRIITGSPLDQGTEGACVGFAVTHKLMARPEEASFGKIDEATKYARETIYWRAQQLDPWPGGAYPGAEEFYEGTSILAGVKAAQEEGFFAEYRWSFSLQELIEGLVHVGPALMGLNWYRDCYHPSDEGRIRPTGPLMGGHAIVARAVRLRFLEGRETGRFEDLDLGRSEIVLRNSWGADWGPLWGDCLVTLEDMEWWLKQYGEAVFSTSHMDN